MVDNNEYANDTKTNDKLHKLLIQNIKTKVLRNDDNDLVPHHEFQAPSPQLSLFATSPRSLQSVETNNTTQVQVNTLTELYPGGYCAN